MADLPPLPMELLLEECQPPVLGLFDHELAAFSLDNSEPRLVIDQLLIIGLGTGVD